MKAKSKHKGAGSRRRARKTPLPRLELSEPESEPSGSTDTSFDGRWYSVGSLAEDGEWTMRFSRMEPTTCGECGKEYEIPVCPNCPPPRPAGEDQWREQDDAGNPEIHQPPHYTYSSVEPIDAIEAWALPFHLGNVVKYLSRAGHKQSEMGDLLKAQWYLNRYIELKQKG